MWGSRAEGAGRCGAVGQRVGGEGRGGAKQKVANFRAVSSRRPLSPTPPVLPVSQASLRRMKINCVPVLYAAKHVIKGACAQGQCALYPSLAKTESTWACD